MSGRERLLAIATAVAVVFGLFFYFYYEKVVTAFTSTEQGSLLTEEERFQRYAAVVNKRDKIHNEYENLTLRNVPETRANQRPGDTFMNELARVLTEELGQPNPRIEPYQMSPIPKVEDYYFVDVDVSIGSGVDDLIRLLEQMERRGLLIKEFTLELRGMGGGRRGNGSLKVKVSRLVQHDEISRRQLRLLRNFRR
jgi:hypothetical protein